ncbi:reverse transcriptase N-terminal domain-containing protein [Streptomyces mirabilis]|uniref:reverse transcriptase N-terminal domain-containing protein n=1 Tax=Streptomyces mirabilis TaxID=68239 RepID=UPI003F4CFC34
MTELAIAETRMNGPEGDADFWHSIDWSREETSVKRLRQRIFTAAREGEMKQVRNLQKLMLRSRANTLTSVRRVCQVSTGKKTAGIDGQKALTPEKRGKMARQILADPMSLRGLAFSGQASDRSFHAAIRNFAYSAWTSCGGR